MLFSLLEISTLNRTVFLSTRGMDRVCTGERYIGVGDRSSDVRFVGSSILWRSNFGYLGTNGGKGGGDREGMNMGGYVFCVRACFLVVLLC